MKNVKKILGLFFVFLATFLVFPFSSVSAETKYNFDNYDYFIDSYDISINISENNVFEIQEKIAVQYNVLSHGIYRYLPMRNYIEREDGSKSNKRAEISNVSVDTEFSSSKEDGYYVLKIGSSEDEVIGKKEYLIKYTYNLGKDPLKDKDELYYNIIGTMWDTVIKKVTFTINMPKEFDSSSLGFSVGKSGSVGYDKNLLHYSVNDKVIKGSFDEPLLAYEGLTIRLTLPEDYFVNEAYSKYPIYIYIMMFLPILFIVVAFILWYIYGRDNQVIETVEFYPPDDLNSLDIAYAYKGRVDKNDVVSLLICLANKGYLSIQDNTKDGAKSGFVINKLKDYDGNDASEKIFFDGLFNGRDSASEITLKNSFYRVINTILFSKNNNKNHHKLFYDTLKQQIAVIVMSLLTLLLVLVKPMIDYYSPSSLFVLIFIAVGISVFFYGIFRMDNFMTKIFLMIWSIMFVGFPFFFFVLPAFNYQPVFYIGLAIGVISIVAMMFFLKIMEKRNDKGIELLGKIKGFKTFLINAEKDKLETLVNDDPEYFYNILPYAYVLGVSDKWMKKFETITLTPPEWYAGDMFDIIIFNRFFTSTLSSINSVMNSTPSSSGHYGGGGFSGGGFSGGGSGGGGGGRW